jgi:hypothetical protein
MYELVLSLYVEVVLGAKFSFLLFLKMSTLILVIPNISWIRVSNTYQIVKFVIHTHIHIYCKFTNLNLADIC